MSSTTPDLRRQPDLRLVALAVAVVVALAVVPFVASTYVVTVVLPEQRKETQALMRKAGITVTPQRVADLGMPVAAVLAHDEAEVLLVARGYRPHDQIVEVAIAPVRSARQFSSWRLRKARNSRRLRL